MVWAKSWGGGKEKGKTGGVPGTSYMYRYGFCTVRQYSGVYGWGGVGTATVVGRTKSSATHMSHCDPKLGPKFL